MSQQEKAAYFRALKDAGVPFSKHYREYTTAELKEAYSMLEQAPPLAVDPPQPVPPPAPANDEDAAAAWQQMMSGQTREQVMAQHPSAPQPQPAEPAAPVASRNPDEMAGQRLNAQPEDEPIRVDPETGFIWYQEEVTKPGFPKPRGRRVLTYMETGVETKTVQAGNYMESFEVAATGEARTAEVKITLPSYQVGIYRDPRLPFRVHVYNSVQGFDLFEVQNYYGGADMVPAEIKRIYVENVLCYDIRTTVRAIQDEFRRLQLAGKVQ